MKTPHDLPDSEPLESSRNLLSEMQQLAGKIKQFRELAQEWAKTREQLHQLAYYNTLTGLPNLSLLQKDSQALFQAEQQKLAVIFIDVNGLKQVNDSLGRAAGNELLRQIANRLRSFRGQQRFLAHLKEDDFVLLRNIREIPEAALIAENIMALLSPAFKAENLSLSLSFSIGIAVYPDDAKELDNLILYADMAMRNARQLGCGPFRFYTPELNHQLKERQAMERALLYALENNQLHLHYQPQICMQSGDLYGVEALARWNHPELGKIPPDHFIALAERLGVIKKLSAWAIRSACRQLAEWRQQGVAVPRLSINVSPSDFHNSALPDIIQKTLQEYQLQSSDLALEITENVFLNNSQEAFNIIDTLHQLGIHLALDDFGTGYSSLSYLHKLPIQELKLDRSFIQTLELNKRSQSLCEAIFQISKSLGLTVIVEGVETEGQKTLLQQQGYQLAQGYLFARPLSVEEITTFCSGQ